jgi:hypothetical protein
MDKKIPKAPKSPQFSHCPIETSQSALGTDNTSLQSGGRIIGAVENGTCEKNISQLST